MLFTKGMVGSNELYRDIGRHAGRPFVILATTLDMQLGDLLSTIQFFCTVKGQFEHAMLHVCYRDVRPYSRDVVSLAPNIDKAEIIRGELPRWLRSRAKRDSFWRPLFIDLRMGSRRRFYDLILNDWMADSRNLHALPNIVPLRIPPEAEPSLAGRLAGMGVAPDHWFAVIHYREGNYAYRANLSDERNSDPEAFRGLVDHIIDTLGGQVVRIGHPEMRPFPKRDGFVDLSRDPDCFMLQAFAVSAARFTIVGPTGSMALACGFEIPCAIVDATDAQGGWGNAEQLILTKSVTTPKHGLLRNRSLLEAGLLARKELRKLGPTAVQSCTWEELAVVANHLHGCTSNMSGWRPPKGVAEGPRPNMLEWPPQTRENLNFLDA